MTAPLPEQGSIVGLPAPDPHLAIQCSREGKGNYGGLILGLFLFFWRRTKMVSFARESAAIDLRGDLLVHGLSDSDGRLP